MANFINSADRVIMPIAIVSMVDEFKWDLHSQGWVLSSFAVGYMSSQVNKCPLPFTVTFTIMSAIGQSVFCNCVIVRVS
jgi:hypothetical protein